MPIASVEFEEEAESLIRDFVLNDLHLAVYDPGLFRRPRVPVVSFDVELLEVSDDSEKLILTVAGPVVLKTEKGLWENHLRLTVPVERQQESLRIGDVAEVRAVYIVETDEVLGTCKETAALANV